jgi:site-specific DNA-methyltransferase (adenine-specific)
MINSVLHGDCLEVLKTLPDNSVDAVVTDPPAGIAFMGKSWDKDKGGRNQWIAWMSEVAAECLRVIKPGGHALVWAIPRTSHWTGTAWEDAGWDCRDKIFHCFGSGFPKSLDVSKAIDRAAGAEREVVGKRWEQNRKPNTKEHGRYGEYGPDDGLLTAPATPSAKQWEGWGTALKPAVEEWWLFRKPLAEKTVAANVLEHGTGALNIDGCRVKYASHQDKKTSARNGEYGESKPSCFLGNKQIMHGKQNSQGRFPAHLIHDGSEEVLACFPDISGSAARFFYCAKASKRDRDEGLDRNHHPTVKPTELMRYLCRLITPPGGTILDPFCGSGSTGKGAILEDFNFIGIEQDAEYVEIAKARIAAVSKEVVIDPTHVTSIKTNQPQQLTLFA